MKKRFLMSISGGRSSAMLAKLLIDKENLKEVENIIAVENDYSIRYYTYENEMMEVVFAFANTSREKEATLLFMNDIKTHFGIKVTWVEAVVHLNSRKGCTHKIVNFNTACRNGDVFENVIKKYGIPNKSFPHCTRELKTNPIRSFLRAIGWGSWKDYKTIIGYRKDEPKRATIEKQESLNQWYPLYEWMIKKPDVAYFWNRQIFDLDIPVDADGNCKLCYKKSDVKIIYQYMTDPDGCIWIYQMQDEYSNYTPESRDKSVSIPPYNFFRHNRSLQDIINEHPELKEKTIDEIIIMLNDKSKMEDGANYDLYEQEDCSESCEAFGELENISD
jgi:hypothetical protein